MNINDVYTKLCAYDTRNPECQEMIESGLYDDFLPLTNKSKANCYCDNCFHGRTLLAEEVLRLLGGINE